MPDIFISYSRKDSEQALELAERLQGEGMSVWIDQRGIEAAKTWSEEIVNAIEGSKAFVLLLSSHSIESGNVAKELSLAYESERTLIPVMIEDVPLTAKFKYPLAGVQRVAYSQFNAITTALIGCGVKGTKATSKKADGRKSLLVMPFEDLSPTQDNLWFADGLAGELIDKLSHIKSLRLIDRKTSRELRSTKLKMYQIAETLQVQYVIEGSVRKFGEQIKISAALLDVTEGEHLWQRSHKGTMDDVFALQETVAAQVVEGLQLHLGADEKKLLADQYKTDREGYELYLRGVEYSNRLTRSGLEHAVALFTSALDLDPSYVPAMQRKALSLSSLYGYYGHDPAQLREAEALIARALELRPDHLENYSTLCYLYAMAGRNNEAEATGLQYIRMAPKDGKSYFSLARFYFENRQYRDAVEYYEKGLEFEPERIESLVNLVVISDKLGDEERAQRHARAAVPLLERKLQLHPDHEYSRLNLCVVLHCIGADEARILKTLEPLLKDPALDGHTMFNLACLFSRMGDLPKGLSMLQSSLDCGYLHSDLLSDPDLDPIRSHPEYKKLIRDLDAKELQDP